MAKPWEAGGTPSKEELQRLVDKGMTNRQIGEQYGVTESGVRYWLSQVGIQRGPRPEMIDHRATGAIPWQLNTKLGHENDPIAHLLRARNRVAHGMTVSDSLLRRVKELEENLAAEGLVIDYDSRMGFMTRRRDDKLDAVDEIVRRPRARARRR